MHHTVALAALCATATIVILLYTFVIDSLKAALNLPRMSASSDPSTFVELHLAAGVIELKLFDAVAPKTVENFVGLINKNYYNGVIFHRVIRDFMIQGGDPTGTGRGGQSLWGKPFADECDPSLSFDRKGLLAMANAGPNTNGSQFFITVAATPWLNGNHTIFGEVVSGYEVVEAIENTPTGPGDRPIDQQVIERAIVKA